MRFGPRNTYYLRISEHTILPLYVRLSLLTFSPLGTYELYPGKLYLDERHIDWMSERVLQHVLEDLRPRIVPKLRKEADARLGPGGPTNAKRGSVEVYRGDTYQFGYFLRNTDEHAVLVKTRNFVPAPGPSEAAVRERSPSPRKGKKRGQRKTVAASKRSKKPKTKGKQRAKDTDEDETIAISDDEDGEVQLASPMAAGSAAALRRSARTIKQVADYKEQNNDEEVVTPEAHVDSDIEMDVVEQTGSAQLPETSGLADAPVNDTDTIAMDASDDVSTTVTVKEENTEPTLSLRDDAQGAPSAAASTHVPEPPGKPEEDKTKLMLQLKYHGFNVHGRCLCVIVEPYPPLRSASVALSQGTSTAPMPGSRAPSIAPSDFFPGGGQAQRARTPLFLPEYDRERSVTPAPVSVHKNLPPVPLFHEAMAEDSDSDDGGMILFSQILQSVGQGQGGMIEDDDEIEGAVFFGDADETREL
ncbi:uncharacterized protein FIBRA_05280 [Fibroporia radiculosa]|uniref:Uncharacterized protein n=1 Tax=Fibroporia radiculosa TaxID=599839 RepID=J4G8Z5_9APHY|nr:uncharacterized protein FIBRA_05280 [Fibroporia radiculosa]CCM03158.1 predicted protein [Fibroporia radiculosa]